MFDIGIGFSELLLLAVIVIIVVGPEELPSLLRTVGRYVGQVKRIADDFRSQVDEAIKDTEIDKLKDEIKDEYEGVSSGFDDDPFGEEDLIDFEEHNRKILEDEEKTADDESAAQKTLRDGGIEELGKATDPDSEVSAAKESPALSGDDRELAKKSGT